MAFIVTGDDIADASPERPIGSFVAETLGTVLLRTFIDVGKVALVVFVESANPVVLGTRAAGLGCSTRHIRTAIAVRAAALTSGLSFRAR